MQMEDSNKFETVINKALQPLHFGYLREKKIGLVGGKVEAGESIDEALQREIASELAEVLGESVEEVEHDILPNLHWSTPESINDFLVVQSTQTDLQADAEFRGLFELNVSEIKLDSEMYQQLQHILKPISLENTESLRPYLAELLKVESLK